MRILLSNKKQQATILCDNIDEPQILHCVSKKKII